MSWISVRKLSSPVLFVVLALLVRKHVDSLQPAYKDLLHYIPYLSLSIVIVLSVYYNRARLLCATLTLLFIFYLIQNYLQTTLSNQHTMLIYTTISVLHPLYLLSLLFLPERGLRNRHGMLLIAGLLGLCIGFWFVFNNYALFLSEIVVQWFRVKPVSGLVLSFSASAMYLLLIFICGLVFYRQSDEFAIVIISVALFSFITLAKLDLAYISAVMFIGASVSLIVGILGSSYDMAYRDELTGLLGRRALNDRLKGLGRHYVIAMMDIDHFKKFNDTHGHDIGDEVLKMVAQQIARVDGGGTAYRYGGEEFCVIFSNRDMEYAEPYLEDVRLDIQDYEMRLRNNAERAKNGEEAKQRRGRRARDRNTVRVSVTISIGMAEPDENNRKPDEVLKAADQALYKAKKKGRNCLAS
ncbi:MAG: diguanylate cyclase [Gammaproteobacteria bacterium]|nr:diguanylate cyclase [Gammaproteobacteria bacterium]